MKTIYDMTSGTFRKELEDSTCNNQIQLSGAIEHTHEAELQIQEYVFDTVSAQSVTDNSWLLDIEVKHFIDKMK